MNALLQLPIGDYWDHVMYTTLEPCLLCTAALTHTHVGTVRYAAPDALWAGVERLPELNEDVRKRWCVRQHQATRWLQQWGSLLPIVVELERGGTYRGGASPALVSLGRELARSGELRLMAGISVSQAIGHVRSRLEPSEAGTAWR